jgi:hypothetical protein
MVIVAMMTAKHPPVNLGEDMCNEKRIEEGYKNNFFIMENMLISQR